MRSQGTCLIRTISHSNFHSIKGETEARAVMCFPQNTIPKKQGLNPCLPGFEGSSLFWVLISSGPDSRRIPHSGTLGTKPQALPYQRMVKRGDIHPAVPCGQFLRLYVGFIPDLKRSGSPGKSRGADSTGTVVAYRAGEDLPQGRPHLPG